MLAAATATAAADKDEEGSDEDGVAVEGMGLPRCVVVGLLKTAQQCGLRTTATRSDLGTAV